MNKHETYIIDIETSGLPYKMVPGKKPGQMKKQNLDYKTEYMDFPFIVSMSWARNEEDPVEFIINPEGRDIPKEVSDIHGITTEMANKSDKNFVDVIKFFMTSCQDAEIIVGHGLYFDTSTIKANVLRAIQEKKLDEGCYSVIEDILHKDKRIDTMRSAAKMCRKWPTLSELHQKIFRKGFDCHSALDDVQAARRCYFWMLDKGIVPTWDELQKKSQEKMEESNV